MDRQKETAEGMAVAKGVAMEPKDFRRMLGNAPKVDLNGKNVEDLAEPLKS